MRPFRVFIAIAFLATSWLDAQPGTFQAKVVGIADGDTITIRSGSETIKIRLHGIDCPEAGAEFSRKAKSFTSALIFGEDVTVRPIEKDRYGRTVARVLIDDTDVSVELVRAGLAWHYVKYAPDDEELARAQKVAKAAEIGIWSLPNPLPPWEVKELKAATEAQTAVPVQKRSITYHGNRSSHIFHAPHCRYYTCKNCTRVFNSKEEAVKAGYRGCKICRP